MSSNHTNMRARSSQGMEVSLQTTTTESPILPIAQLEQLKTIAPDRVDWVFEETSKEAAWRRQENSRVNSLRFYREMASLLVALVAVVAGIGASVYCASINQPWVAGTFATTTIVGLAWAFNGAKPASASKTKSKEERRN